MKNYFLVTILVLGALTAMSKDITTLDGKTYKNVQISSVTPVGFDMAYKNSEGVLVVKEMFFRDLPENVRKELGYNPKKAEEFKQRIHRIHQERARERAQREREKFQKEKDREHLLSNIYAHRLNVRLKVSAPVAGGVIAWADAPIDSVTTGHYGKVCVWGLYDLPNGGSWAGYIYPTGKSITYQGEVLPCYTTSSESALIKVQEGK